MSPQDPHDRIPELDLDSARRLALVALHTGSAVVLGDAQGFVEWVNDAFVRLTGYGPSDVVGKPIQEVLRPREADEVAAGRLRAHLARGRPGRLELRVGSRSRVPLHLSVEMQQLRDSSGQPTHFLVMASDVSQQRAAEEEARRHRDEALETQRRECVQGLAAGLARRFEPLLERVLDELDVTAGELPSETRGLDALNAARRAVCKARDLSRQLETIAGQRPLAAHSIDLSDLVVGASSLLDGLTERRHALDFDFAARLPPIRGDLAQLRELLRHVVANAFESLGEEPGRVRIRTGRRDLDEATWARTLPRGSLAEAQCVFLEVTDTGCGIEPALEGRVFDPFVTTKNAGRGLGLATILGLVQGHRAGLLMEANPGRGTTVTIHFPCSARVRRRIPRRRGRSEASSRPRRVVLLVEDDASLRDRSRRTLRRAGFRVLTSPMREGLDRFRDHAPEIDAVLLAPTLPGPAGEETLRSMRLIRPDVRFVFTSPYQDEALDEELAEGDVARFLQKPYTARELVDALRGVLRG